MECQAFGAQVSMEVTGHKWNSKEQFVSSLRWPTGSSHKAFMQSGLLGSVPSLKSVVSALDKLESFRYKVKERGVRKPAM